MTGASRNGELYIPDLERFQSTALFYALYLHPFEGGTVEQGQMEAGIELIAGDLETLFRLVVKHGKPVSEGDLRAASAILRRWLCDDLIGRLANKRGVTPTFPVLDNASIFDALGSAPHVIYYLTGGVRMNGMPVSSVYDTTAPSPEEAGIKAGPLPMILVTAGKMRRQPRIYHAGNRFTCEQIIRFTANKLGGVHLDFARRPEDALLEEAGRYMTFGGEPDRLEHGRPGKLHLSLSSR